MLPQLRLLFPGNLNDALTNIVCSMVVAHDVGRWITDVLGYVYHRFTVYVEIWAQLVFVEALFTPRPMMCERKGELKT